MSPLAPIFLAGIVLVAVGLPAWAWFVLAESFVLKNAIESVLPTE